MAGFLGVVVFRLKFKHDNFIPFSHTLGSRQYLSPFYSRSANGDFLFIGQQENFIQFDLISFGSSGKVYIDRFPGSNFILFTTCFNNSVNGTPPKVTTLYSIRSKPLYASL
jgi:hypothetical protein